MNHILKSEASLLTDTCYILFRFEDQDHVNDFEFKTKINNDNFFLRTLLKIKVLYE